MELEEFVQDLRDQVRSEVADRMGVGADSYPYTESVFVDVVTQHMSDEGMTAGEPEVCHHSGRIGNALVRVSGYAISDDGEQLDLFIALFSGDGGLSSVSDTDTKAAAEHCLRFFSLSADGRLLKSLEKTSDAYPLASLIHQSFGTIDQVKVYVLTDRKAKTKNFQPREAGGKLVKLEVMDIERLHRHISEGKPREEIVISFEELPGGALPALFVPGDELAECYVLTVIPAEALRRLYEKYGGRLLQANVRSFLSAAGKVNKGIRETLRAHPERFVAYNNGIVITADSAGVGTSSGGVPGLTWLKGLQIVNGGQTTASLYFAMRKVPGIDLARVRVPAKVVVLKSDLISDAAEEVLVSDISRYSNSQTAVRTSDLSANKPFHVELEKLSESVFCPDGVGRWFYERAAGSYNVFLDREGKTPARRRNLKDSIPTFRRITKTDLAKYLQTWRAQPHVVSRGAQKNFEAFMSDLDAGLATGITATPDREAFKRYVAVALVFKTVQKLVRKPRFTAFQANTITYTVAAISRQYGQRFDLDRVWREQGLSPQLVEQGLVWATEVEGHLQQTARGRMISEWAKKEDCWNEIAQWPLSPIAGPIPELRPLE